MRLDEELMGRLRRLAQGEGLVLLAVEVGGTARRPRLRLVLDRPGGGVSLRDCERVSRQASLLLDEADPCPGPYTLEVSSPGLDRKLYGPEDYERFAGRVVRVRLRPAGGSGRRVVEAFLVGRREDCICLRTPGGEELALPESEVLEARLDPFLEERWTVQGRPRPRGRARRGNEG